MVHPIIISDFGFWRSHTARKAGNSAIALPNGKTRDTELELIPFLFRLATFVPHLIPIPPGGDLIYLGIEAKIDRLCNAGFVGHRFTK
ncbi:MAG: hypothetical protein QNJ70_17255 [Xenococcaceae cyanobacterium MO_207.B15]|nr:hypothetical protein [Xenococcaceae cyanobacterium MO_207.B15]